MDVNEFYVDAARDRRSTKMSNIGGYLPSCDFHVLNMKKTRQASMARSCGTADLTLGWRPLKLSVAGGGASSLLWRLSSGYCPGKENAGKKALTFDANRL
jgi:hypothetical protein